MCQNHQTVWIKKTKKLKSKPKIKYHMPVFSPYSHHSVQTCLLLHRDIYHSFCSAGRKFWNQEIKKSQLQSCRLPIYYVIFTKHLMYANVYTLGCLLYIVPHLHIFCYLHIPHKIHNMSTENLCDKHAPHHHHYHHHHLKRWKQAFDMESLRIIFQTGSASNTEKSKSVREGIKTIQMLQNMLTRWGNKWQHVTQQNLVAFQLHWQIIRVYAKVSSHTGSALIYCTLS